jgi:hypothetical protein
VKKGPRRFNVVTALLMLVAAALGYAGAKFGPIYWRNYKVDAALSSLAQQAINLDPWDPRGKREKILLEAHRQIVGLGVDGSRLHVYFDDLHQHLYADYTVVVRHPLGQTTTLGFRRSAKVPEGGPDL